MTTSWCWNHGVWRHALAAARVAEERERAPGPDRRLPGPLRRRHVGWHPSALFITEGLLLRRLQSTPTLEGTAVVVLDEFHERHLAGDVFPGHCATVATRPSDPISVSSSCRPPWTRVPVAAFPGRLVQCYPSQAACSPSKLNTVPRPTAVPWKCRWPKLVAQALRRQSSRGHPGVPAGAREIRRSAWRPLRPPQGQ